MFGSDGADEFNDEFNWELARGTVQNFPSFLSITCLGKCSLKINKYAFYITRNT
jgi:hypothetical protein